jgi:hypothetical protein
MEGLAPLEILRNSKTNIKGAIGMIGVRKLSRASYETPDLDKQTEY